MNRRRETEEIIIIRNESLHIHGVMRENKVLGRNLEKVSLDEQGNAGIT